MQQSRNLYESNYAKLLQSIADATQDKIAGACGHDKSWVSRFQSGEAKISLTDFMHVLDVTGLRLSRDVDQEVTLTKAEYEGLVTFAKKTIDSYAFNK